MSATPFSVAHGLSIHSQVPIDADVGIIHGMENEGLLVKSISYKPTRDKKSKMSHRGQNVVHIFSNPQLTLSVDADITLLGGALAAKHPGTPIHKDYVRDFYPAVAHGFTDDAGYFIMDGIETSSPQGDLNTGKFDLIWLQPANDTAQLVAAPTAP